MRAYMTRNEDVFIPLKVRVAKAQKQRADLFVSIHADAFTSRQPSGSSVFALSTKGRPAPRRDTPADTQNASDLIGGVSKSGDRYVDHTMFDMVQSLTITDSLKFGKSGAGQTGPGQQAAQKQRRAGRICGTESAGYSFHSGRNRVYQ